MDFTKMKIEATGEVIIPDEIKKRLNNIELLDEIKYILYANNYRTLKIENSTDIIMENNKECRIMVSPKPDIDNFEYIEIRRLK